MNELVSNLWYVAVAIAGLTASLHCIFAIAVFIDAGRLVNRDRLRTALVPGIVWAVATLVFGPLVGIGYWIVNRSSIAVKDELDSSEFNIENYLA